MNMRYMVLKYPITFRVEHRPKNGCERATRARVPSDSPLPVLCVEFCLTVKGVKFKHDSNEGIVLFNNLTRAAPFQQKRASLIHMCKSVKWQDAT